MQTIIITKGQKKILLIVGIVLLIFAMFMLLAYLPLRVKEKRLKAEIDSIESDIARIKKIAEGSASIEEAITVLKNKLESLNKEFPAREEIVLRSLSELAAKTNIDIVSMVPQKKKTVTDIAGSSIKLKGSIVQEMSVSVGFKTNYKNLAAFLNALENDFPVCLRVESVQMSRSGNAAGGTLDVSLTLAAYLIPGK